VLNAEFYSRVAHKIYFCRSNTITMRIEKNVSLKHLNTFGIDTTAANYVVLESLEDATNFFGAHDYTEPHLILGGGSNILFTKPFQGTVIKNDLRGIVVLEDNKNDVLLQAGAGENWHGFVNYCLRNNYAGIENLSLIPGNVGASPMQNIGAYGVEVKDTIEQVEAVEIATGKIRRFNNHECQFGYRSSIFKTTVKEKFMITAVQFRLQKQAVFHTTYGAITTELDRMGIKELSIQAISQAVCNIRSSKLPDPKVLGNAGSFFKNPVVSRKDLDALKKNYDSIPHYPQADGSEKLAAGWLIEQCGWKGKTVGKCGVHAKQALVLVNYGGATGNEIYALSQQILESVADKFGVELEREVNII
jgi:UDP-N-acetylmuramate dehydrogenase